MIMERPAMQNKNGDAMLRYSKYTAAIFDRDGTDHGPINVSSARTDAQARKLAEQLGVKWLEENGLNQAIVQVYRRGHKLPVVEVRTDPLDDERQFGSLASGEPAGTDRPKYLN
jgi:hypothetical protein